MLRIFAIFGFSLALSLILTPIASWFGRRFGILALPKGRNIHSAPIPRTGGLALFLSFFAALAVVSLSPFGFAAGYGPDRLMWYVFAGGALIFGVGFADDKWTLPARVKLLFQVIAASVAFYGGVRIESFALDGFTVAHSAIVSYVLTVFWFVLLINAINLIDGLDGLAAGVVFFVSLVQTALSATRAEYQTALVFATLCGVTLGFLRYNFNPASVFLGDGGSYFLGYMMAAISTLTSVKSEVGAAMLMPIIAFGVPLLDAISAPLRRFVRGRNVFEPDKGHVHHKLLSQGWSQRKAVLFIYGITIVLAVTAVLLVNLRSAPSGIFLLLAGGALILLVRKAGYFSAFAMEKLYGWVRDVSDEAGLGKGRRTFLNYQIEIEEARDLEHLWANITEALEFLRFDLAEMVMAGGEPGTCLAPESLLARMEGRPVFRWRRFDFDESEEAFLCSPALMKLELPLMGKDNVVYGALWLVKNLEIDPITAFTLRRVENLRRTVVEALDVLNAAPVKGAGKR